MHLAEANIRVETYHHYEVEPGRPETYIFYIKVSLPETGWFMNSFTARISPKYPETGLWIQPPKQSRTNKPLHEFRDPTNHPVWVFIENQAKSSVLEYALRKSIKLPGIPAIGDAR